MTALSLVALAGAALLGRLGSGPCSPAAPVVESRFLPPAPRSPVDVALREAGWWRLRAQDAVNAMREAVQRQNSPVIGETDREGWRLQQSACDCGGHLRRAREAARRACRLARAQEDLYRSELALARLECESGHHGAELQLARRLVARNPRNRLALTLLRHAAQCNRRWWLFRSADARITALGAGKPLDGTERDPWRADAAVAS
jgi:hypothetical protein